MITDPAMEALIYPFNATLIDSQPLVSWVKCYALYHALHAAIVVPPAPIPPPLSVHPSYYTFLSIQFHGAWQNRHQHVALGERVFANEPKEARERERVKAGF